jgi:DNA-binding MarR family transcriptional regulator
MTSAGITWDLLTAVHEFGRWVQAATGQLPGGRRGFLLLTAAARRPAQSQRALARQAGLDKTIVTYLLDELVLVGLVERRTCPGDRRARRVSVTPKGQECLTEMDSRLLTAEQRLLTGLTADEVMMFRDLLKRISVSLATVPPEPDLPLSAG